MMSINIAGVAQLAERQPSKLNVEGSNPFTRCEVTDRIDSQSPAPGGRFSFEDDRK